MLKNITSYGCEDTVMSMWYSKHTAYVLEKEEHFPAFQWTLQHSVFFGFNSDLYKINPLEAFVSTKLGMFTCFLH